MTDDLNNNEQQKHPADALADLAGSGDGEIIVPDEADEIDPLSALNEMAQNGEDSPDPADFAAAETAADDVANEVFSGDGAPLGVSGGTHVTAGGGYHRHRVHMYKKTMIPLMLVVGAMLVVIGLAAVVMVLRADPDEKLYTRYSQMKLLMYVSFPLSAVVLFGAWWFHRDVNKAGRTGSR